MKNTSAAKRRPMSQVRHIAAFFRIVAKHVTALLYRIKTADTAVFIYPIFPFARIKK